MPAHRDETVTCASCQTGLDPRGTRFICGKCGGALVTASELEAMMNEMSPDDQRPLDQRLLPGKDTPRKCPRCATTMKAVSIYSVTLDQCGEHGIWFDGEELAKVLHENGESYAKRQFSDRAQSNSLGGILGSAIRGLFKPMIEKRRLAKHIEATSPKKSSG
jgi:Zn-finger nucleic acid-binding protein